MVKQKSMTDIWKEMEKQHGDEGLYAGDGNLTTYSDVISTGSHALDDALGIWGIPRGHIIQYAGFESSGKTMLALATIAEWQKLAPHHWAFFVDAEFTFDQAWAQSLGVDISRLYIYRENKAAKIFDRLVGVPGKANQKGEVPKVKSGILDTELAYGGTGLGLIVIDSIAFMQVPMEEASRAGKANMALMARFLPDVLRKITPLLTATGVSLIGINHLRFKPGEIYGSPTTSPGGTALKHACSQMINLRMIGKKETKIFDGDDQIGHRIAAKIEKNKKAPPFRVGEFDIKYSGGIVNRNVEIRDIGTRYGIIERPNNKTWILDGEKYNGKDAITNALLDEELAASVLTRAKDAKLNYSVPVINTEDVQEEIENEENIEEEIE